MIFMPFKISDTVTWVGKIDWELRTFHGEEYSTHKGSSYNSYLIRDIKTVLIDTVWQPFSKEFITNLKKEIEFIESYIALMKLRFSNKVTIRVDFPIEIPEIKIPPMLFISFIENAFKHGVSYQSESYVVVKMEMRKDNLFCSIKICNNTIC